MKTPSRAQAGPADQVRPAVPKPVTLAVRLMYAGAALTVVALAISVIALAAGGTAALKSGYPHQTAVQLHHTEIALITFGVFSNLIEVAVWMLMARANSSGLNWARIAASVLFALNTWNLIAHVRGGIVVTSLVYSGLIWLIGLGAILLLWQRESGAYFAQVGSAAAAGRGGAMARRGAGSLAARRGAVGPAPKPGGPGGPGRPGPRGKPGADRSANRKS
jgi:hypothetical protein